MTDFEARRRIPEETLVAYLDGKLSESERAEINAALEIDDDLVARLADLDAGMSALGTGIRELDRMIPPAADLEARLNAALAEVGGASNPMTVPSPPVFQEPVLGQPDEDDTPAVLVAQPVDEPVYEPETDRQGGLDEEPPLDEPIVEAPFVDDARDLERRIEAAEDKLAPEDPYGSDRQDPPVDAYTDPDRARSLDPVSRGDEYRPPEAPSVEEPGARDTRYGTRESSAATTRQPARRLNPGDGSPAAPGRASTGAADRDMSEEEPAMRWGPRDAGEPDPEPEASSESTPFFGPLGRARREPDAQSDRGFRLGLPPADEDETVVAFDRAGNASAGSEKRPRRRRSVMPPMALLAASVVMAFALGVFIHSLTRSYYAPGGTVTADVPPVSSPTDGTDTSAEPAAPVTPAPPPKRGWKKAIADYAVLYNKASVANLEPNPERLRAELAHVERGLGIDLPADALQANGFDLLGAELLTFNGNPLAKITYRDPDGVPILFCVIRSAKAAVTKPPRPGSLDGLSTVAWDKEGYGYIVIGEVAAGTAVALANALVPSFF